MPGFDVPLRKCEQCGEEFVPKPRGYNAKFCSKSCKEKARYRNFVSRTPEAKRNYLRCEVYQRIQADPERAAARRRHCADQKTVVRTWLALYKVLNRCFDCGYDAHPAALQLDHEGTKTASISELRSSIQRMLSEIRNGKCRTRCSNCHGVKTWCEKNNIPYVPGMRWDREKALELIGDLKKLLPLQDQENDCRLDSSQAVAA